MIELPEDIDLLSTNVNVKLNLHEKSEVSLIEHPLLIELDVSNLLKERC